MKQLFRNGGERMKKRAVSIILCAAMAAGLMAGCGSSGGNTSGGDASEGGKKEVVIWDYFETDAQKQLMEDMVNDFNSSQDEYVASHVYVPFADYEKQLTLGMASGELPDLVIMDGCGLAPEGVMFPLNMFSNMTLRERIRRAMTCLDRVNLNGAAKKYPSEISGGMQKRVAIARAISLNPQYLFCDEPNSGLDPKTSLVIDGLIHGITHEYNMTTIINTHDMNSVMGIGEKIIFIAQGKKEWEGEKSQIFSATNEKLENFVFASDLFKKVKEMEERKTV